MLSFGSVVGIKASLAPIGSCNIVVDFSHNFHLNTEFDCKFWVVFSLFKMQMILDGYCHSYLLYIFLFMISIDISRICFFLSFGHWHLSFYLRFYLRFELLFEIYQSVVWISFAGETRSVSVAVCRPSIDSHTHTRARYHHTHAPTHTRARAMWLCVCGIHDYIT